MAAATFVVGLLGLLVSGHLVVSAASAIGRRFGLTPMVVGLTIVAVGTSAPEWAVVLGAVAADDRLDGVLLFSGLVFFVGWTLQAAPKEPRPEALSPEVRSSEALWPDGGPQGEAALGGPSASTRSMRAVALLAVGIIGLAIASQWVVSGADRIAGSLGIPELIVGLTIVALGTSAPEIVTTLIAALNGRRELAVACLPMVFWDGKLDRWEGMVFVGYYLAYLVFLVLDATGHRASDPFALVLLGFVVPLTVLTIIAVVLHQRSNVSAITDTNFKIEAAEK